MEIDRERERIVVAFKYWEFSYLYEVRFKLFIGLGKWFNQRGFIQPVLIRVLFGFLFPHFFSIPRATEFCFFNPPSSIPLKFVGMSGREGEAKVILINFVFFFFFFFLSIHWFLQKSEVGMMRFLVYNASFYNGESFFLGLNSFFLFPFLLKIFVVPFILWGTKWICSSP